jgi:hypothetical protein
MPLGETLAALSFMDTIQKYKRGDCSPCGTKRFWLYEKRAGRYPEIWFTPEKFEARTAKDAAYLEKWRIENRDRVLAQGRKRAKEWVKNNPQQHAENRRRWEKENPERRKEIARADYRRNKAKKNAYQRAYAKAHPEKKNLHTAARRARLKAALHKDHDSGIELAVRESRRRLQECLGCIFEVDHFIPLKLGGWHHHLNLHVLPRSLNRRKSTASDDRLPDCWKLHPSRILGLTSLGNYPKDVG